jgi:hypothetical protein
MTTRHNRRKPNPAVSGEQYRLAQAVLSGSVRTPTSMTAKVAREIVAKTPAKLRTQFARRQNFLGFGKKKTPPPLPGSSAYDEQKKRRFGIGKKQITHSYKLLKRAYDAGYFGRGIPLTTAPKSDFHPDFVRKMKAEYERGEVDREQYEAKKRQKAEAAEARKDEVRKRRDEEELRRIEEKRKRPPPLPRSARGAKRKRSGKRMDKASADAGYGPYYKKLSPSDQAKVRELMRKNPAQDIEHAFGFNAGQRDRESGKAKKSTIDLRADFQKIFRESSSFPAYVKGYNAGWSAGKTRRANPKPEATVKQGKSIGHVYHLGAGKHRAEIKTGDGKIEEQSFTGPKAFRAAMSWLRLRLHETANRRVRVKVFPISAAGRKNPIDSATKLYEEFHGIPSGEVREYVEQEHRHSVLAGIGPLISMQVVNVHGTKEVMIASPDPLTSELADVVMLTATEDGKQLELTGGNQKLNLKALEDFGIEGADVRDRMLIGTIVQITYRTRKSFEKDGKEEIDFYHDLGHEGSKGICPVLIYKPRNPSLEIAGGRYFIGKLDQGLGASPGIIG